MLHLTYREERRELRQYRQSIRRPLPRREPSRCPHCGASERIMVEVEDLFRVRRKNGPIIRETPEKRIVRAIPNIEGRCRYCGEDYAGRT